jgi:hypothetical protein
MSGAGARLIDSTPSTCQFWVSGQVLKRHERLQNQPQRGRLFAQRGPRRIGIVERFEPKLPLAVVAEPARLQDCRRADVFQCLGQILARGYRHEVRRCKTTFAKQGFFGQAILRHRQRLRRRVHRDLTGQTFGGLGRHVFEIEGYGVDPGGKRLQRIVIAPWRDDQRCDLPRAGVVRAIHHQCLDTQRSSGEGEHARQLTAAQHAEHRLSAIAHGRGSG